MLLARRFPGGSEAVLSRAPPRDVDALGCASPENTRGEGRENNGKATHGNMGIRCELEMWELGRGDHV